MVGLCPAAVRSGIQMVILVTWLTILCAIQRIPWINYLKTGHKHIRFSVFGCPVFGYWVYSFFVCQISFATNFFNSEKWCLAFCTIHSQQTPTEVTTFHWIFALVIAQICRRQIPKIHGKLHNRGSNLQIISNVTRNSLLISSNAAANAPSTV